MPVSHFGLPVSDIRTATRFFLSALHPLGYRYFGQQGDSIGLGIQEADFFLTQISSGFRPAPTHVAFAAKDRSQVRQCYAAALRAGGYPSGSPEYRNDDCSCYNAAIEDADGNTVEFIFRTRPFENESDYSVSRHHSRARRESSNALDLASYSPPRKSGLQRARTEPVDGFSSKALLGTMLGAAAGAAFAYAMVKSDKKNTADDESFAGYRNSRGHSSDRSSRRRSTSASISHLDSGINWLRSRRGPPPTLSATALRAIDSKSYHADDDDFKKPPFDRRQLLTGYEEDTKAMDESHSRSGQYSMRRSTRTPMQSAQLLLENARSLSRHNSRRGSVADSKASRHDSVISRTSGRIHTIESSRRSHTSQGSTIKPTTRTASHYESAVSVGLPPSLPPQSIAGSKVTVSKRRKPALTYYLSNDKSHSTDDDVDDDDDWFGDAKTLAPEDSISCVGVSASARVKQSPHREVIGESIQMPTRSRIGGSVLRNTRNKSSVVR